MAWKFCCESIMSRLRNIDRKLGEQLIDTDDQVDIINLFTSFNDYNFALYSRILSYLLILQVVTLSWLMKSSLDCINILSITLSWLQLKYNLYRWYLVATNSVVSLVGLYLIYNGYYLLVLALINFFMVNCVQYWYEEMKKYVEDLNRLKYKYKSA